MLANLGVERAVLSSLCQGVECDYIEGDHFSNELNQHIFRCIRHCKGKIEFSSLLSSAKELNLDSIFDKEDEISFVRSLFNFPVSAENIDFYAGKLVKLKFAKDSMKVAQLLQQQMEKVTGDEEIAALIEKLEGPIDKLVSKLYNGDDNATLIGDGIDEYIEYLEGNPVESLGVPNCYFEWSNSIGGLGRGGFHLIGGRSKAGKSLIADNIALSVCDCDIPVLMIDTEMGKKDHVNRMLAIISGVEINEIRSGAFSKDPIKREKVKAAAAKFAKLKYHYVSVAGQPIENVIATMKKWVKNKVGVDETGNTKDCLIIYDYFKLMDSADVSKTMQEYQVLGFQATKLHNFCVKYDVPCLGFIQLNRDGITKESADVISQSDRIAWLCTSFSIFKAKSDEEVASDGPENGNRKMVVVLARHGGGSEFGDYINYNMRGEIGRITELRLKSKSVPDQGFKNEDGSGSDF